MVYLDMENLKQRNIDESGTQISKKDVIKTASTVNSFVSTMLKLNLADSTDLLNFKLLNLPWYASKTANLRRNHNLQRPQQQRESETSSQTSKHFLSDSNKES